MIIQRLLIVLLCAFAVARSTEAVSQQVEKFVGDGDSFDAVVEVRGLEVDAYIAHKPENEPVGGAKILLQISEAESETISLDAADDVGHYHKKLDHAVNSRTETPQVIVQKGEDNDIVSLTREGNAESKTATGKTDEHQHFDPGIVLILGVAIGGIFLGGLLTFLLTSTRKASLSLLFAMLVAGTLSPRLGYAHDGHDHAPMPGSDQPSSGGIVTFAKKSQFLVGVKSQLVEVRKIRNSVIGFGHVHPKPQLDALLTAPQPGFIRIGDGVALGANIKKGQVLGYLDALARISIISPIDGELLEMDAVTGARVDIGAKLFHVTNTERVWIDAELYQNDLASFPKDPLVEVMVDGQEKPINGRLVSNRTPLSEETRTARFFVELENSAGKIRLGSLATVYFRDKDSKDGISLPKGAVLNRGGEQVVILQVGPESFKAQTVISQRSSEPGEVQILDGLKGGERIVVAGNYQLLSKVK